MSFEYKCVGAPERPKRQRGVRGRSDRVALAMQEIIAAEAVDGWEYQRTDLVPVEEKYGLFSRAHEVHRAVLVFRRELDPEPRFVPPGRLRAAAAREPGAAPVPAPPPEHPAEGREMGRDGGRDGGRDARMTLAADRDEPPAPPRGGRDEPTPPPSRGGRDEPTPPPSRGGRDEPAPPTRRNRPPSGLG